MPVSCKSSRCRFPSFLGLSFEVFGRVSAVVMDIVLSPESLGWPSVSVSAFPVAQTSQSIARHLSILFIFVFEMGSCYIAQMALDSR